MLLRTLVFAAAITLVATASALAQAPSLPATFTDRTVDVPGARIYVQVGGRGTPVLLLHGYTQTSDMWGPLAAALSDNHTVIVPDLRGLGRSSRPADGYDKATQAQDIRAVVQALGFDHAAVVGHDIGNMVAYAYAASYPTKVTRLVVMDAALPGIGPWVDIVKSRALWHFAFGGPDAERLVAGRERIYLDRFWNEFAAEPAKMSEDARSHYAGQYAQPGAMRAGFAQFAAFARDAEDNARFQRTMLTMPVLAIGGEKSFGSTMAAVMRHVAIDVREAVVPGAGHWLIEESPAATVALVEAFLEADAASASALPVSDSRVTPGEFTFPTGATAGAGTSGTAGIRTTVLKGDPKAAGLYTILLSVPANTTIQSHTHPDDRIATVIAGTWWFGYGPAFDEKALKALPPGSFYTEAPNRAHFARTGAEPVLLQITGLGPTGTTPAR